MEFLGQIFQNILEKRRFAVRVFIPYLPPSEDCYIALSLDVQLLIKGFPMRSVKLLVLGAILSGPVIAMADGCPTISGIYKNGEDYIQVSQSMNAQGRQVYRIGNNGAPG